MPSATDGQALAPPQTLARCHTAARQLPSKCGPASTGGRCPRSAHGWNSPPGLSSGHHASCPSPASPGTCSATCDQHAGA
eukprot:10795226-Lingulodinium_polyedra.AAC.1